MNWLIRVKIELHELQNRITLLEKFLSSAAIEGISIHQLSLMSKQLWIMKEYENVLKERIEDAETK